MLTENERDASYTVHKDRKVFNFWKYVNLIAREFHKVNDMIQ
jgi:hypothetical protein